ncbi:MAG: hypothetical protein A3G30_06280 [Chlamydiae bacterium RIFCSPLOWO2_12_FULL_49_12]|nr:MAG: hypothetical protein A3G30_06280 [Chlamydiae bacterium RIFCSPLOWO2_12_FULL_49_12]
MLKTLLTLLLFVPASLLYSAPERQKKIYLDPSGIRLVEKEIFVQKTLKELKRFRKEQLDPFLQKNSNFKSVDFVQDFIKKTDTGFSLISFFTDLILCLVSFLFSFNRHPNNSKN